MDTKHTLRDGLRKELATLAISATLIAACGSASQAPSGTSQNEQRASVVHDPGNPYWIGSPAHDGDLAASTQSGDRRSLIHDPANPYWWMSSVPADTYADPVRGDR